MGDAAGHSGTKIISRRRLRHGSMKSNRDVLVEQGRCAEALPAADRGRELRNQCQRLSLQLQALTLDLGSFAQIFQVPVFRLLRQRAQRGGEAIDHLIDGTLPKQGLARPFGMRGKHESLVPIKSPARVRLGHRRHALSRPSQCAGNEVFRIPKLASARVVDPGERAAAGRSPIGDKNRFPNNKYAHSPLRILGQEMFGCRGPLQTIRSRGRKQQDHTWHVEVSVEHPLKLGNIRGRQLDQRRLNRWHPTGQPEIEGQQHYRERGCADGDRFLHRRPRTDKSAMKPAIS